MAAEVVPVTPMAVAVAAAGQQREQALQAQRAVPVALLLL
jgi:hypothetical protein